MFAWKAAFKSDVCILTRTACAAATMRPLEVEMTTDADVIRALADLGMDEQSVRALPLLPLLQVAWADGEIQVEERQLIQKIASERFDLGEEGERLVANWLRYPPTTDYLRRGREALSMVAGREGSGFDHELRGDVLALAKRVAKASGGLFGIGAVSKAEQDALNLIATALDLKAGAALADAEKGALPAKFEKKNRVTITFSTSALDVAPMGGVLEVDDSHDKLPVTRAGLTIGADPSSDIHIEHDGRVSAKHAKVYEQNRKFYVTDLESDTGTFVNGERIAERRLLGGETIRVGVEAEITFKLLRRIPKQMV
jgi:hypothetical protein